MDDTDLTRAGWRSLAAFQRLIGLHGPDAEVLEHDAFVASRVPATHSSLINAAVPRENGIAEHLDEIERFYDGQPKWGVWIDPARTRGRGGADRTRARARQHARPHGRGARRRRPRARPAGGPRHASTRSAWSTTPPTTSRRERSATRSPRSPPMSSTPTGSASSRRRCRSGWSRTSGATRSSASSPRCRPTAASTWRRASSPTRCTRRAERGQITTSLQASKLGQGIYARLGYQPLGEIHLYERRP